ncbi:DUF502 domain-containing protein [Gilvimarinus agarilyticus]|uniref:DUF502 domain-containing protein n=1 Tax=unclassified Gilvimarinus TaxID=2642066 RepID=UPI001C08C885|nr:MULTISPECIES: DUF502 domain-containing protein [unclassified Gilvimarinus]MBU2884705.1 DUF502 domain-containing protein [Gilvimarinus agarilyticus]MDO6569813.1 DUF502 domain-containing protein [Gilvimarinus sp. 2_MG-2023]MDO6747373.1 DUF502 domain-containing protein [Gilvimarinus sp. 1_MG-2023]
MTRLRSFITLTLLGGLTVVLPITIFLLLVQWLVSFIDSAIEPLSAWLAGYVTVSGHVADMLGVGLILAACFTIGLLVKTGIGRWLHRKVDGLLSKLAPGYSTIREMVSQIVGGEGNASLLNGKVCRAYIMGKSSPVCVTGIVTAEHEQGSYTVYVPTAPVPTSGFVYHLPADCIELLPGVTVESAMRTVIACGSGSQIIMAEVADKSSQTIEPKEH